MMTPKRANAKLDDAGVVEALRSLDGWNREDDMLVKVFRFPAFMDGIAFVNRVARAAESMDHHPDVDIRYTKVRVALSTHSVGGISELDVELARQVDAAAVA